MSQSVNQSLHHSDSGYCCRRSSVVCLFVLVMFVSLQKTAQLIEMPFGADSCEPKEPCIRWGRDLLRKRQFRGCQKALAVSDVVFCAKGMDHSICRASRTRLPPGQCRTKFFPPWKIRRPALRPIVKILWSLVWYGIEVIGVAEETELVSHHLDKRMGKNLVSIYRELRNSKWNFHPCKLIPHLQSQTENLPRHICTIANIQQRICYYASGVLQFNVN